MSPSIDCYSMGTVPNLYCVNQGTPLVKALANAFAIGPAETSSAPFDDIDAEDRVPVGTRGFEGQVVRTGTLG